MPFLRPARHQLINRKRARRFIIYYPSRFLSQPVVSWARPFRIFCQPEHPGSSSKQAAIPES
jgi:hypothetical protein